MEVIDKPKLKSPLRHLLEGSITLALWALWLYWLLPIINLILWIIGIRLFYYQIFVQGGYEEFIIIMKKGGLVAAIITAIILIWVYYNYLWFLRRGERRTKGMMVIDEQIAHFFGIDPKTMKENREKPCISVLLEKDGISVSEIGCD